MTRNKMLKTFLANAYHSGAEVILHLRQGCCEPFQGAIHTIEDNEFTLFHSGEKGGILWTFHVSDIMTCGLVMNVPGEVECFKADINSECSKS